MESQHDAQEETVMSNDNDYEVTQYWSFHSLRPVILTGVLFCFIYVPPIAVQSTSHTETTARVPLELPKMTSTTVLALCKQFEEYSFKQESPFIIFVILQFEGVPPAEMNEIDFRT